MAKSHTRAITVCIFALVILLGLVLFSSGASRFSISLQQQNNSMPRPKKELGQRLQEIDARVPSTAYDSPEPTNPEEKAKRWKKNKHYDRGNWVMKNPSNEGTRTIIDSHVFFALPALPTTESDVIVTGDVLKSEAHLSNDKSGVYSEFTIEVNEVLKGAIFTLSQTRRLTISRPGGLVRYPSGHVERYEISNQYMPATGKRYLFFLKAIPDTEDYEIVTGYDIGSERVQPLDGGQFESFRGKEVGSFINTVRDAIAKN